MSKSYPAVGSLGEELPEDSSELQRSGHYYRALSTRVKLSAVASCSSRDSERESISCETTQRWTCHRVATILILGAVNLIHTMSYSILSPFFTTEALKKGITEIEVGMIFGVFELAEMFSSFIFGKYLNSIGSKFMLITGAAGIGVNSLLFGWVIQTRNGHTFLVCCIIIRIFKGLSSSAVSIASFAILAHEYSGSLSTIVGVLETCCGIGVIGGPPLGGLLYFYGGFKLPFILVGAMSSLASGIGYFLLPSYEDRWMVRKSYLPLMKQWELFFPLTTLVIATSTMSFLDLALAPFVEQFNHSSEVVGLMFMVSSVSYILTAPLWGLLVDKKGCTKSVMMFGSFITATAFFLLGALPMLDGQLMKSMGILWGSLAFVGIGLGAQIIPPFDDTLRTASRCGYLVSFDTLGLVSGLTNAGYSFGSFLGPALGGIGVKELGFYWSGTALSIMNASIGILFVTYFSVRWCCSQASDDVFRN